jgi:hypothetical protein
MGSMLWTSALSSEVVIIAPCCSVNSCSNAVEARIVPDREWLGQSAQQPVWSKNSSEVPRPFTPPLDGFARQLSKALAALHRLPDEYP